ncbi:conserved hypothetical protein [Neorickettsia risticii str. Illinois]|uniref:Uncharacterized protein n=1 Tax=Neorickettsia risticii (strain Illinois) TaxID=434131 RepID=C6V670_NEORI|nr:hypothetical protein [Neorickettsia risticii]ACT69885.1 conserved hypothetical protein [Neorickettsia risticii str. Illinois]
MKKLINDELEDKTDESSSDARYRARMTEQQQSHLEELKKLQESFKEKAEPVNSFESREDFVSDVKEGDELKAEKKVEVSRKKGLFRVIADKFSFAVRPSTWAKVISGLRSLFGGKSIDELLLEIKAGNKTIKSLLALLKHKEKLSLQIRIAALLREIRLSRSIGREPLSRILAIQGSLISNLSAAVRESSGKKDIQKLLGYQHQALTQSRFLATQVIKDVQVSHSATQSQTKPYDPRSECPPSLFPAYYVFNDPLSHTWISDLQILKGINISATLKNLLSEVKNRIIAIFSTEILGATAIGMQMQTVTASSSRRPENPFGQDHQHRHIFEQRSHHHGGGCPCCSHVLETSQSLRFSYSPSAARLGGPGDILSSARCNLAARTQAQIQI